MATINNDVELLNIKHKGDGRADTCTSLSQGTPEEAGNMEFDAVSERARQIMEIETVGLLWWLCSGVKGRPQPLHNSCRKRKRMRLWKGHSEVATCGRLLRLTTRDYVLDPRHTFITVLCNNNSAAVVKNRPFCGCVTTIWDLSPHTSFALQPLLNPQGRARSRGGK